MAHPGGPLTTNKAAALAKFLERKLQQPDGLDSLNPDLVNLAVKNAMETIKASKGMDCHSTYPIFICLTLEMHVWDELYHDKSLCINFSCHLLLLSAILK